MHSDMMIQVLWWLVKCETMMWTSTVFAWRRYTKPYCKIEVNRNIVCIQWSISSGKYTAWTVWMIYDSLISWRSWQRCICTVMVQSLSSHRSTLNLSARSPPKDCKCYSTAATSLKDYKQQAWKTYRGEVVKRSFLNKDKNKSYLHMLQVCKLD